MPICKRGTGAVALVAAEERLQQGRLDEGEEAVVEGRVGRRRLIGLAEFALDPAADLVLDLIARGAGGSRPGLRSGRRG